MCVSVCVCVCVCVCVSQDLELMKSMAADLAPDVQTSVTCQGHTTDMQTTYRDHYVPKDMTVNT